MARKIYKPQPVDAPPEPIQVTPYLDTLLARKDLTPRAAAELMEMIVSGRVLPPSLAAVLIALRAKGETVEEIAAFAKVMRDHAIAVKAPEGTLDTCGTGGDKSDTFNISTATAFVVAGIGIPVAKHGGRSVSSKTGSADVLKALGVNLEVGPSRVEECINAAGIGFMFAPAHHPAAKNVAPIRRELGVRTIFNLLGPLSNPAGAKLQLLGVFEPALCETFAKVLKELGSQRAMVVCGAGPGGSGYLDEMSTFGETTVARLQNGKISIEKIDASKLGLAVPASDSLAAKDCDASAKIIRSVLSSDKGPARDIVVLNAAAAAIVAGKATDWKPALALAEQSIDSGRALKALDALIATSNK